MSAPKCWNWTHLEAILVGMLGEDAKSKENLTYDRYFPVFHNAEIILTRNVNIATPSIFKQAAAFVVSFIKESPLRFPFSEENFDKELLGIQNHQNAIVAFEYARHILRGATIHHSVRGSLTLKDKIKVSRHFYFDVIHALANSEKESNFHFISLLLESLAYKTNDGISDDEVV